MKLQGFYLRVSKNKNDFNLKETNTSKKRRLTSKKIYLI